MNARGDSERSIRRDHDVSSIIIAAHELKSPLVVVRQLALLAQSGHVSEARRTQLLDQIVLLTEKGLRLTSDLTKTERIDTLTLEYEPLNPKVLCEQVARDMLPLYREYGKSITVSRRVQSPLIVAHRDLLARIVQNFSDNALHYSDEAGNVEVFVRAQKDARTVRIGVRDYGPAIPADLWRSLRRERLSSTTASSRPLSSGLGLYIADRFARAMGGSTGVIRHRDGATFYVDMPVSEQLPLI